MNNSTLAVNNPLSHFMRQPKIYIRLPSNGQFWPEGSLLMTENSEFPVYSMTAKDELLLKIPDALMNGQSVVDVIQNCMPNIKNAWHAPSIDLDVILIAIRLATYGEKMTVPLNLPDGSELEYQIDLRVVLDNLMNQVSWISEVQINPQLTVFVKPLSYSQITTSAIQAFETQKIMEVANNNQLPEDEKLKMFKESFKKLTDATIGVVSKSIYKVDTIEGGTTEKQFIEEFANNIDKDIFNAVEQHLEMLKERNSIKPVVVPVTDEMKEKGINGDTVEIPLTFDPSTFFG